MENNELYQKNLDLNKRLYSTVILASFVVGVVLIVMSKICLSFGSLFLHGKEGLEAAVAVSITAMIFSGLGICSAIICIVFFIMRPR